MSEHETNTWLLVDMNYKYSALKKLSVKISYNQNRFV